MRRRRGGDVDIPSRGDAAATTWMFRGDGGDDVGIPRRDGKISARPPGTDELRVHRLAAARRLRRQDGGPERRQDVARRQSIQVAVHGHVARRVRRERVVPDLRPGLGDLVDAIIPVPRRLRLLVLVVDQQHLVVPEVLRVVLVVERKLARRVGRPVQMRRGHLAVGAARDPQHVVAPRGHVHL